MHRNPLYRRSVLEKKCVSVCISKTVNGHLKLSMLCVCVHTRVCVCVCVKTEVAW